MKYIVTVVLVVIGFGGGVIFENSRLVGEPDKTIAVMLARQAVDNSNYQMKINSEYVELLHREEFELLKDKLISNSEFLSEMNLSASSVCMEIECTKAQKSYVSSGGEPNN